MAEQEPAPVKDTRLSPEISPSTMELKTRKARRINNWPVFIAIVIGLVVVGTLCLVLLGRSGKAKPDSAGLAPQSGKVATAQAKELTTLMGGEGGLVNPPAPPELPKRAPEPEPKEPPASLPGIVPEAKAPKPPQLTEEAKKVRDRRFRQMEQAIDGPIQVRIDERKLQNDGIDGEMARLERQLAALSGQDAQSYEQRLAAAKAAIGGGDGAADYAGRNDLSRTKQFSGEKNWTNPATVEAPAVMHIIRTGSVIPATLVGGINSDLPGQIIGQVSQNVYDTPTGKYLLIPQGSRLVGEYSSQVQYGQSRVFAVWQRLIFPDGKALDLGEMPGSSGAGYAGFRDRVNNHYIRIFGSAIMMSAILAGVEMTQDNSSSTGNQQRMSDAMSEALGNQLGGVMAEMLQKNMNIAPTLEIRPGYRFNVMLVRDLVFSGPYSGFDYARQ